MKRIAFLLILLLSVSFVTFAQTQVATLQHGDDISVFYGATALIDAHDSAETGDIITLSSGSFASTTITKAITLRGAGCDVDTVSGTLPTIIPAAFYFSVEDDTESFVTVEGILFQDNVRPYNHDLHNPKFIRCHFAGDFCYNTSSYMYNAQFINCYFIKRTYFNVSSTLINCAVEDLKTYSESNITIYNSIIAFSDQLRSVFAYNCILYNFNTSYFPADRYCTFYNCIGIKNGNDSSIFQYQSNSTNIEVDSEEDVFAEEGFYVLNDEIASDILGTDGTQVGIYGGFMPYSTRPTYMVLKRCNVANKTTIDGKLSVDIEVVTEGK